MSRGISFLALRKSTKTRRTGEQQGDLMAVVVSVYWWGLKARKDTCVSTNYREGRPRAKACVTLFLIKLSW